MSNEAILNGLQGFDVKQKIAAIEQFVNRLDSKYPFKDVSNDVKIRLMSACVSILRDANSRVVLQGFKCLQKLLDSHSDAFKPLVNLTFDQLLNSFTTTEQKVACLLNRLYKPFINYSRYLS